MKLWNTPKKNSKKELLPFSFQDIFKCRAEKSFFCFLSGYLNMVEHIHEAQKYIKYHLKATLIYYEFEMFPT